MLFTFPSRYLSTIGLSVVFSLAGWSPLLPAEFLVFRGTQVPAGLNAECFAYGTVTLSGHAFLRVPLHSTSSTVAGPTTPGAAAFATAPVWALPRSLAATCGIIVIFSSCGY